MRRWGKEHGREKKRDRRDNGRGMGSIARIRNFQLTRLVLNVVIRIAPKVGLYLLILISEDSPILKTSVFFRRFIPVLDSQPAGDPSHKPAPAVGCHYFPADP